MVMDSLGITDLDDRDTPFPTLNTSNFSSLFSDKHIPFTDKTVNSYNIKYLKCGGNHTLILLENGILIGAGELRELRNDYIINDGWCLLNYKIHEFIKSELNGLVDILTIESISTCWDSTFIGIKNLEKNIVQIFSFGQQCKMELGRPECNSKFNVLSSDIDCVASELHSCLYTTIAVFRYVNNSTVLYGWGFNNKQQLFETQNKSDKFIQSPKIVKQFLNNPNVEFRLGKDFLIILNYKENSLLCLGNPKLKTEVEQKNFLLNKISNVIVMWSSLHFLYDNKSLVSLGNGQLGQLSLNNSHLGPVKFLEAGSEHIIYTSVNEPFIVSSWGWGEHGNCGKLDKNKNDINEQQIFTQPNEILNLQKNEFNNYNKIQNVYGGCASTFILITKE